jgi:hypothetical protein
MRHLLHATLLGAVLLCTNAIGADAPAHIGRHSSTPEDSAAIHQVITEFQAAIKTKNPKLLSTLVLNSNILFASPAAPDEVRKVRESRDVSFDGIRTGGYNEFARYIGTTKEAPEEKFYNIKVTQDGHLAWVMFDYEFLADGKVENYGVETWQMLKTHDGKWKIASVMWSMTFVK